MQLTELLNKSILVLGYGVEGISTFKLLRELFPKQRVGIADSRDIRELLPEGNELLTTDSNVILSWNFGRDYLSFCDRYDVIIKSPGIKSDLPEIQAAVKRGAILTSHTEIFLRSCRSKVIGVTGTKGKGTTSKLIYTIFKAAGFDAYLVGNIGNPPLQFLKQAKEESIFVFEMSSQQLEEIAISPHIAICLKIVPDHLDHHGSFEEYVSAKQNITLHQTENDYFIFNPEHKLLEQLSKLTKAKLFPFSLKTFAGAKCYVEDHQIYFHDEDKNSKEAVISVQEALNFVAGDFNLNNILPAIAVAKIFDIKSDFIIEGIKNFEPLSNRFEKVGTFKGVTFYNASISTVPEVTIEHISSLGAGVQTVLLGGFDRGIDFSVLGKEIQKHKIKNLILFPTTGDRIWEAVRKAFEEAGENNVPNKFLIESGNGIDAMREAVGLAYEHTDKGKICLHSPASPSFGLFKDFQERGNLFKKFVVEMGSKNERFYEQ